MLLERPGQIITRDELRSKLWPGDTFVDFEHGVNSGVARLREALGDSADSPRYIETLPRRGYRLIVSVEGVWETPVPPVGANGGNGSPSAPVSQAVTQPAPQTSAADIAPPVQAEASAARVPWRRSAALAAVATEAVGKGGVLKALDTTAVEIRRKLGESLSSIQKNDVPIEQATTTSLEGLKAFSLGQAARNRGMEPESIPYFQNAIELDPNFAMAYAVLGQVYANMGENALSVDYTQKAFDRRERASERENLYISSHYYEIVTRDLDRTAQIYELWRSSYPRDVVPAINLGSLYNSLGQPD